jgi:hypothetical protein
MLRQIVKTVLAILMSAIARPSLGKGGAGIAK